ncbi:MAG: AAA family ATPase [Mycobacteriales bacterium]|nr:AAA family ATPase [Mycobacteriales bacterium]
MSRYAVGLVWGKFLPLHAGHSALIRHAAARCDRLVVVLGARHDEPIDRDLRQAWLEEEHPDVEIRAHWDDADTDYGDPVAWDLHVASLRSVLPEDVDAVFTSEEYGEELARRLGCAHELVDLSRSAVPVSGTAVRADPAAHWQHLPPAVRAHYVRRVVVLGAESTGTTTLAQALAQELGCAWVPEYGRTWSEIRPGGLEAPWASQEFDDIAVEQSRQEDVLARETPVPWLIADTDALATAVWHERYLGIRSRSVEALAASRPPALYVLTSDDVPFVQDGLRDGEHLRPWMTERFREVLRQQPAPWLEVRGSVADRVAAVLTTLALPTTPGGPLHHDANTHRPQPAASLDSREELGSGPLTTRYDDALLFASSHHRDQLRKGSQVPYLSHLMAVSGLVLEHGGDEDTAIAALLHDSVEDAPAGTGGEVLATIRQRFGEKVADIVRACSDGLDADGNRSGTWAERKRPYIEGMSHKSPEALLVTAADKTHNARCIVADVDAFGPDFWRLFNACPHQLSWYYGAVVDAVAQGLPESTIVAVLRTVVTELVERAETPDASCGCRTAGTSGSSSTLSTR